MRKIETSNIEFTKSTTGLIPAIIQDNNTLRVLMLGYMNLEALQLTLKNKLITFYSRSKNKLWVKGESSGNYLTLIDWGVDCDNDTLLFKVNPHGPVCHTGSDTCWEEDNDKWNYDFLKQLENIINLRKNNTNEKSYVSSLFSRGINKIAQKVGEEAVETIIEALNNDNELFINESSDLLFHFLILLQAKGFTIQDVINTLEKRHLHNISKNT